MAANILIQRKIKPDCLGNLLELSLKLRSVAVKQPGYISGETLVSSEHDHIHLIISTWRNLNDWKAWEDNTERKEISKEIDKLLEEPSKIEAFIDLYGAGSG